MGTYQPSMGASLGPEPGLDICPGMCLMGAVRSPGPRCPPSAVPLLLSTSSAAGGVSSISACGAHPFSEGYSLSGRVLILQRRGGHGLWDPLSPPGPPELRPQEAEPPRVGWSLPRGAVQMGMRGLQPAAPRNRALGGTSHVPQTHLLWSTRCSPRFGGACGAQSHASAAAAMCLGRGGFTPPAGTARQRGLPRAGPCPGTCPLRFPAHTPGREPLLWPPYSPPSIPAAGLTSHLPSCPRSGPIPLTPPAPTGPYNP